MKETKINKLQRIYNWLKILLGLLFTALGFVSLGYGLQLPEATPETHLTLILLATCTPIVLGAITFAHGVCGIDKIRAQENRESRTRRDVIESAGQWIVEAYFTYSVARETVHKHYKPEEVEIIYDKLAEIEWRMYRDKAPPLPQTKFYKSTLDKILA